MKNFKVVILETHTYEIEVEAKNEEDAVERAYQSFKFTDSISDDIDSIVSSVEEI